MYEHLQALHQRFFTVPDNNELHAEIQTLRNSLNDELSASGQRLLLRLLDAQNELKNEISLESFVSGFKLAGGIAKELESSGLYSFDEDIEQHIR